MSSSATEVDRVGWARAPSQYFRQRGRRPGVLGKPTLERIGNTSEWNERGAPEQRSRTVLEGPSRSPVTIRPSAPVEHGGGQRRGQHDASPPLRRRRRGLDSCAQVDVTSRVLTAAHHLAAISALIRTGEAIGPPMALARAVYEQPVMGSSALDPRIQSWPACRRPVRVSCRASSVPAAARGIVPLAARTTRVIDSLLSSSGSSSLLQQHLRWCFMIVADRKG